MSTLISTDQVVFATREGKSWCELRPSGPWLSVLLFAPSIWWYFGPVIGIWRYFTAVTACNKCPLTVTPPGGAIKSNPRVIRASVSGRSVVYQHLIYNPPQPCHLRHPSPHPMCTLLTPLDQSSIITGQLCNWQWGRQMSTFPNMDISYPMNWRHIYIPDHFSVCYRFCIILVLNIN